MRNTIAEILSEARQSLKTYSDTADLDARVLLSHCLGFSHAELYSHARHQLDDAQCAQYETLLHQRVAGVPIAYLTGHKEFYALNFKVNRHTLVPRPETECIVDRVLQTVKHKRANLLELGTGSGAIALALAHQRPQWQIDAVDNSAQAIAIAAQNKTLHVIDNVTYYRQDWFGALTKRYHAIVSNPPYLASDDPYLNGLKHEPRSALVAGQTGYESLQYIINNAAEYLLTAGYLIVEHGATQAKKVRTLFATAGFVKVATHTDLAGLDRITMGQR